MKWRIIVVTLLIVSVLIVGGLLFMNKSQGVLGNINKESKEGIVSASELYVSEDNKTIKIADKEDLNKKIADIRLNTPLDYNVGLGYQKVAEFTINSYGDYINALSQIQFYNKTDLSKEIQVNYDYKFKSYENVNVNDYGDINCTANKDKKNSTQVCDYGIIGSHIEQREVWIQLDKSDFKAGNNITIGIFTITKEGDKIEWIPTLYGRKITEWAGYSASLKNGLVVYYNMNEPSDTTMIDSTNNVNATAGNKVYPNYAGKLGTAWDFDRTGNNRPHANLTSNMPNYPQQSLSAWIKVGTLINGQEGDIFNKDNNNVRQFGYNVNWDGTNTRLRFQWKTTYAVETVTNLSFNSSTWVHIAVTFDDTTNVASFYINGINTQNVTNTGAPNFTVSKVIIGASGWNGATSPYDGSIDELGWWNRTLTYNEVQTIYNSGTGLNYTDPTGASNCWGYDPATKMLSIPVGCVYQAGTL